MLGIYKNLAHSFFQRFHATTQKKTSLESKCLYILFCLYSIDMHRYSGLPGFFFSNFKQLKLLHSESGEEYFCNTGRIQDCKFFNTFFYIWFHIQ